jgi:hypothetical protein
MTQLSVKVLVDEKGDATVEFDKSALRAVPLEDLMREVAAMAEEAAQASEKAAPRPAEADEGEPLAPNRTLRSRRPKATR